MTESSPLPDLSHLHAVDAAQAKVCYRFAKVVRDVPQELARFQLDDTMGQLALTVSMALDLANAKLRALGLPPVAWTGEDGRFG